MKTLLAVIIGALGFGQAAITIDASRVIYSGKDKSSQLPKQQNYIVQDGARCQYRQHAAHKMKYIYDYGAVDIPIKINVAPFRR